MMTVEDIKKNLNTISRWDVLAMWSFIEQNQNKFTKQEYDELWWTMREAKDASLE